MMGRGRGNFKSSKQEVKFGSNIIKQMSNLAGPRANFADANETTTTTIKPTQYDAIITNINLLDPNDDGILTNQKYRFITEKLESECASAAAIEEALDVIHQRGLYDAVFASKLVSMLSSISFNSLEIHNMKIRNLFVAKLQHDFDNCKDMQIKSPIAFRNAVRMLGEYYHKARFTSGQSIKIFASPLWKYLDMLLESAQEEDLELFAIQLYMNGNGIKANLPQKLNEMLLQARNLLANNDRLTSMSKMWLLLALDVAHHRFGLLPNDLQKFYVSQLGDEAMTHFQRVNTELTIQTIHKNELLDKFSSTVNVLKVDNASTATWDGNMSKMGGGDSFTAVDPNLLVKNTTYENHDGPKPSFGREKYLLKAQTYKKISPDNGGMTNIGTWDATGAKKENAPRPILGVGARLKSTEKKTDDSNWRDRGSGDASTDWRDSKSELNPAAAGWESKPKSTSGSGWGNGSNQGSSKKSWSQHDDRTENDYTNS